VLNIDLATTPVSGGSTYRFQTISMTVPSGKVWKVESVAGGYNAIELFQSNVYDFKITIDQIPYFGFTQYGNNLFTNSLPLWLNEGIHAVSLGFRTNTTLSDSGAFGKLSILEFNVIPQ
jgi:hypothetical protein